MCIKRVPQNIIELRKKRLDNYIDKINYYRLFNQGDEKALLTEIQKGNEDALENLIKPNLYIVIDEVKKYITGLDRITEAISEGNNAIIQAGKLYNGNTRFKNYALPYVRNAIRKFIQENA